MTCTNSLLDKLISSLPSLEASQNETEIEIYVLRPDLDTVSKICFSREHHVQYSLYVDKSSERTSACNQRVRETIHYTPSSDDPEVYYDYTMKIRQEDGSDTESTFDIDLDFFKQFSLVADRLMTKMRYFVPIKIDGYPGAHLQVDQFTHQQEEAWVKIDLELPRGTGEKQISREQVVDAVNSVIPTYDELLVVFPRDKIDGDEAAAKRAKEIMQLHGIVEGPFKGR